MIKINIAKEFSPLPGPRFIVEGDHSGELFRRDYLRPRFIAAREAAEKLTVELDGARFGYPTSFLEEAFGGLARLEGIPAVLETLNCVSTDEPLLVKEIENYIRKANMTSRERAEAR